MSWIGKLLTSLVTDLREPRRYFHLNILQYSSTCHAIPHFNFPALFSLHLITAIASSSQSSGQNEGGKKGRKKQANFEMVKRWGCAVDLFEEKREQKKTRNIVWVRVVWPKTFRESSLPRSKVRNMEKTWCDEVKWELGWTVLGGKSSKFKFVEIKSC